MFGVAKLMSDTLVQQVTDRYLIKLAVRKVSDTKTFRRRQAALSDFTPEVLQAFVEGFYLPLHQGKVAFRGLVRKLKQLVKAFKRLPKLWTKFKQAIGVEKITELPRAIKDLAKRGYKALRKALAKIFDHWPLKIFTIDKGRLLGVSDLINKLIGRFPRFQQWMKEKVSPKLADFDTWLRKKSPILSGILMVAIYIWIWLNVVEFEWDFKGLMDAATGALTLPTLLASLPGSVLGFLLNAFQFGTFTLLPVVLAARILWLLAHKYIRWSGRGFEVNEDMLAKDLEVRPEEIPAAA
jgi:hypothetical protein